MIITEYDPKYIQAYRNKRWRLEKCVPTEAQKKVAEIGRRPAYAYTSACTGRGRKKR